MTVPIMPPHLGHSVLCPIITLLQLCVRHNCDTCFGSCNNIGEVFEKLRDIKTGTALSHYDGSYG